MIRQINYSPNQPIPQNAKNFVKYLASARDRTVQVNGLNISIFGHVFPPGCEYSASTEGMYGVVCRQHQGKKMLDLGTGTGVLGLLGAKHGAQVDAVDKDPLAVSCAQFNALQNNLPMNVWQSDMFSKIPEKKYDLIVANLPILPQQHGCIALFDPNYRKHIELFTKGPDYLVPGGPIFMETANLIPSGFENLEQLARNFAQEIIFEKEKLGFIWRTYQFTPK